MSNETTKAVGDSLADDSLPGGDKIGDFTGFSKRRVYHLADHTDFPAIKVGGQLFSRKSWILEWLEMKRAAR
jgi:predicted DNA-binding transcriptional regulator AlpA